MDKQKKLIMRNIKIKVFLISLLLPVFTYSQTIEEKKFDKFDSTLSIRTETKKIANNLKCFVRRTVFKNKEYSEKEFTNIYFIFRINTTAFIDSSCKTQILFTDGTMKDYAFDGSPRIYLNNDMSIIYLEVNKEDELYNKEIKAIRISHKINQTYEVKPQNASVVKDMLTIADKQ